MFVLSTKGGIDMLKLKTGEYLDKEIDSSSLYLEINEDGTKTLGFNISPYSDIYEKIENETSIFYNDLWYLVKEINEDGDQAEIICSLDRDELKESIYESYKSESATELELIHSVLSGTEWTVSGTSNLKRKTIEMEDVTKLDILIEISGTFECYLDFDNVNRIVYFSYPDEMPYKGLFISEQVNLKKSSYTADSYDLVTRIYGFGKTDDETGNTINFASINNGKNYVENLSYKNRIISKIIRDDRFTVSENLLDYCQKELEKYSQPIEAFNMDVIDLAKLKEDEYYMYNFNVRDLVDYVDRKRNKRVRHRIVKYIIYPFNPEENKITLSTNPINLESIVTSNSGDIKDLDKKTQSFLQQAQQAATELINSWAEKGHVIYGGNEIYILDKLPKETAKYCIRINLGGIAFSQQGWQGPYVSAWTIDGKFNADFITAGTLKAINVEGVNLKGVTGEIAGFTIGSNGFTRSVETKLKKAYTQADADKAIDIILSGRTPTKDELYYYDLDNSGHISSWDALFISDLLAKISSDTLITEVIINPKPLAIDGVSDVNSPAVSITYKGKSGTVACSTKISARNINTRFGRFESINSRLLNDCGSISLIDDENKISTEFEGRIYGSAKGIHLDSSKGIYVNSRIPVTTSDNKSGVIYLAYFDGAKEYLEITTKNGIAYGVDIWESDSRLKKNIINADISALSVLREIQHHEFDWIKGGHVENGYVAQELEQLNDRFVLKVPQNSDNGGLDYKYQINSSAIIPYLSKSIQELDEIAKNQQKEIDELKKLIKGGD